MIVGENSSGGANMNTYYSISDYIEVSVFPGAPVSPVTPANWEGGGIVPDIKCSPENAVHTAHLAMLKSFESQEPDIEKVIMILETKGGK